VFSGLALRPAHSWPLWQRELHRALPMLLGAIR